MRKKIVKFVLAFIAFVGVGLVLTSCVETKQNVHIFIYDYSDNYITTVRTELEKQLKNEKVKYTFHDAAKKQDDQNAQIDSAIAAGATLLVVNIVEPGSAETVIRKAKDKKLPILFFNREIEDKEVRSYKETAYIGTDTDEAGIMQGELVAEELLKNWDKWDTNKDGKINYVMLRADLDNPEANGRTKYSVETCNKLLKEKGKEELVLLGEPFNAEWDNAKAKEAMSNFIEAHKLVGDTAIELVFANNDGMALGAITALQQKEYNKGNEEKTVMVVGVDAIDDALKAMEAGHMFGTVKQDGIAMATAVREAIINKMAGKDYVAGSKYQYSPSLDDKKPVNKVRIPYSKITK